MNTNTDSASAPEPPAGPASETESLEIHFGSVWLVRIGIVILLTGFVFLGNLAYQHIVPLLGPGGKLAAIGLAGGILCFVGDRIGRGKESLRNYARVLFAGGCATLYYTAYASHFVAPLRVIDSPLAGGFLLLALAGGVVWAAHRRKSESLAVLAVLLTYYVSSINPVDGFTLYSSLLLTLSAVVLMVRHRWMGLSFASLAGSYGSYLWWRLYQGAGTSGGLEMQLAFLSGYWIIFLAGALLLAEGAFRKYGRTVFLSLNNAAFFAVGSYEFIVGAPAHYWLFSLLLGVVLTVISFAKKWLGWARGESEVPLLAQGVTLLAVGLVLKLTGLQLSLSLAALSLMFELGRPAKAMAGRAVGWLCAIGAVYLALREMGHHVYAPFGGGAVALVLTMHGWLARRQDVAEDEVSPALIFSIAAVALGALSAFRQFGVWEVAPWWAAGAVGITALSAVFRFRELAFCAQPLIAVAFALWFGWGDQESVAPLAVCLSGSALAVWWLRQRRLDVNKVECLVLEGIGAACAAATGAVWMTRATGQPWMMAVAAGAGVVWMGAALWLRGRMLALAGLAFSLLSVGRYLTDFTVAPALAALCPSIGFVLLGLLSRWARRLGETVGTEVEKGRPWFFGIALVMLLPWSFQHIPSAWLVLFFATVAAACALGSFWLRALAGAAQALAILADLLMVFRFGMAPTFMNLAAILVVPVAFRVARAFHAKNSFHEVAPVLAWVTAGLLTYWLNCANEAFGWALGPIVLWALLAPLLFAAGFVLRERSYRQTGLLLLVLCIGKLFVVDVWQLSPLGRTVSFLVLGAVLVVMGYFYNRFQEKLRQWL